MVKITEFQGKKGYHKEVYSDGYNGTFTFKLSYDIGIPDCEVEGIKSIYCSSSEMTIQVFSEEENLDKYDFKVKTFTIDEIIN